MKSKPKASSNWAEVKALLKTNLGEKKRNKIKELFNWVRQNGYTWIAFAVGISLTVIVIIGIIGYITGTSVGG